MPRAYYGPDIGSYVEQIVVVWNELQANLLSLRKEDQYEITDYFNTYVCQEQSLGTFLFTGRKDDVA